MLKNSYVRQLSGISKPEVEEIVSKKLTESELSGRLDSFAQINSDLDNLEANEKAIDCDAMSQEIVSLDDAIDQLSTEPSHWASLLSIDIETNEISSLSELPLPYKPVHYMTPTVTEPGIRSPIVIQSGGVFKQNTFFGNDWDVESVTLLCKRVMIDSFLFSLTFSFLLLVSKSAVKSIIITVRENRESVGEVSSYQRLRGGWFVQRAIDHFLIEMELKIDEFLNNPVGALFLKRLIMIAVFGSSSGYIVWLVYCLSIRFGFSNQADFEKSIRSLKSFSGAWSSFIISAALVGCVGTVFGLLILSGWSMYLEISSFDHSRRNALLERERIERQRLLNMERESIKLMERLSKLDKSKLERYMDLISKKKVQEKETKDAGKKEVLDKDKSSRLSASDKLRLKICSINEASRKLLFHTCPNLYQSEYTSANLGGPLEKAVFNFLSGEDIETTIEHINTISELQLKEELGDIDENQPTYSLSEQSLCLVAIRIGLIKEFMPELYTGLDTDLRKFLDEILVKGFKRCAFHAENAKLFDYGGQKNLTSDKPKFALFSFGSPLGSKGYKILRGGSSPHLPSPSRCDVQDLHKKSLVRFFEKEGYAGPNGLADFYWSGNPESKKNRPSILWLDVFKDRTLLRAVYDSLDRNRKANYGPQHTVKIQGSLYPVSTFAYMPELLAKEFNRLQKVFGYKTPPVLTQDFNEIARRAVLSDLANTLEEDYDIKPNDPSLLSMVKTFNSLMLSELGETIRRYNDNVQITEADKESETVEISRMLGEFAQKLLEKAKDKETLGTCVRKDGSVGDDDHIAQLVAEMVQSVAVQVTNASSLEDITEEVKRLLRRIVESSEGVHNYEQIKYMVAIFMLRRHVKINSSLSQKLKGMVSERLYRVALPVCSVIELILAIPEAISKKYPKEWESFLKRKFDAITGSDVAGTFDEVKGWIDDLPSEMQSLYKKFGGTRWDEKEMGIVLAKLAGFDKRPLTKEQEMSYKDVAKKAVNALVIEQQVLRQGSLSQQLAKSVKPIDGAAKAASLSRFQQAANITDFSLAAVDEMNKGYELPDEIRRMNADVKKMARMLDCASKHRSIAGYPTQTAEETVYGSPTSKPAIEQLSMYLLSELSDIIGVHRAFRIDKGDGRLHGFFGHYDELDSQGMYSSPTRNSLWALTGTVYNPGYGQFREMEKPPFNIRLKKQFSGNVATFGYEIENVSFGSATSPLLYIMFDHEDGNGPVLRPLINIRNNGGLISHGTQITNGPTIKEIKRGQQFNIPALAEHRRSAALCLTQPTNLSLSNILEHWISNISAIADAYEIAGKADGSFYDRASVKDILMEFCDDFNNAASYQDYIKELIETGEMPLEASERGKNRTCVLAYAKEGIEQVFGRLYKQFNVPLLDRVELSDPEKSTGDKKVYGSSMDKGSVCSAKIDKLNFDPTFDLEIFRLLTHYPLVMLSTNLQGKIVGDEAFCVKILACYYRQKSEELKKFRGSEQEFAERYPYCKHKDGLAGFIHESLHEEIIPLIQASQSGSKIIVNENFILLCCEGNIIRTVTESAETESKDEGDELYQHAINGVRSSVLRSICIVLPEYIGTVDDLELFFAMIQVEWGSGCHLRKGYVTLEDGEMTSINEVAQEVEAYIKHARDACITKDGKRLIRKNLISSLQNLINDIHKTHPLRSLTLFHEFTIHRLVAFGHFLHVSDRKQKDKMKERLTKN